MLFVKGRQVRMLRGDIVGQLVEEVHKMLPGSPAAGQADGMQGALKE